MNKLNLILVALLFININSYTQTCFPDGKVFTTQQQINNFPLLAGNCKKILGDVEITGTDIDSLTGLSNITGIGGDLYIHHCYIVDFSGLDSLSIIDKSFLISYDYTLSDFNGFNGIDTIYGNLDISGNYYLDSITGFENLKYLGGSFIIQVSDDLLQVSGFNELNTINGSLIIKTAPNLSDITGFSALEKVGHDMIFGSQLSWSTTGLTNFEGLHNLDTIGSNFNVYHQNSLINMEGLESLKYIGSGFRIGNEDGNKSLKNLLGLSALTKIGSGLSIIGNDSLVTLSGITNLDSIGGNFKILSNNSLLNLGDFNSLKFIGSDLNVSENGKLENLIGLDSLNTIDDDLIISSNPKLQNLSSFSQLETVNGEIMIENNDSLSSLSGIDNIEASSIVLISISNNLQLSQCEVKSICDYLSLHPDEAIIENNYDGCNSEQEVIEACHIVGIGSIESNNSLFIYPNPSNSTIYISSNKSIEIEKVQIFNQNGKMVLNKINWETGIDVSGLKRGLFVVEVVTAKQIHRTKLIIK